MKKTKFYQSSLSEERSDQSVVRLHFLLTFLLIVFWGSSIAQKSPPNQNLTGCDAVTLPWGQTVTTSGAYSYLYKNKFGKDSLVTYNVTVNYSVSNTINASFCEGTYFQLPWGSSVSAAGSYSHTYKASNGCDSVVTVNLTKDPKPKTTITGKKFFCPGSSSVLDAGSGFSSYLWSTGATTQTISVTNSGTYSVIITDGKGCTGTASTTITFKAEPKPTIKGKLSFCDGGSALLTASGNFSSYLWSTGGTTKAITVNAAGTYTLTVTNAGGCTGTASATVTVDPNPTPVIYGNVPFCPGGSAKLDAGAGYNSYLWSNGETGSTIDVNTAGTFTVTVTNAQGCTGSVSATTTLLPEPKPVITGDLTFCADKGKGGTTLDAGAGYASYLWSDGSTSQTINITTSGTWTVTVTNADGCSGSASVSTKLSPNPKPSIKGLLGFCPGNSTTLDAGSGYASYLWSDGSTAQTITVNTAATWTVTVTTADGCTGSASATTTLYPEPKPVIYGDLEFCDGGSTTLSADQTYYAHLWSTGATTQSIIVKNAGTYTLTVSNMDGCTGSSTVTVVVNPNPVPVISGNLSFCAGKGTTLDAGAGYASYLWSDGSTTQTISVNKTGSYTVTVTNADGCSGSATVKTTLNPDPKPSIKGNLSFCPGNSTTLDAGSGYASYAWSDGSTTQTISVSTAGTWAVTVTNAAGCSGSDSVTTTLLPEPKPAIYGDLEICDGESTTLTADNKYASYLWSTGATTQSISVKNAGTYTLTVTNSDGCSGTASVTVNVNPTPEPVISGDLSFCPGKGTTLDAGGGYATYLWSNGATTQTISVNASGTFTVTVTNTFGCSGSATATTTLDPEPKPVITGNMGFCAGGSSTLDAGSGYASYLWSDGSTNQTITVSNAGTYSVTVTNAAGCSASASASVTVYSNPTPAIYGLTTICDKSSTTLSADKAYSSYVWSNGATTSSISVSAAGTYTLTVTNANGCSGSAQVTVTVNPAPVCNITGVLNPKKGQPTSLCAPAGMVSYLWSNGATTQCITVTKGGNYAVTVTNAGKCSSTCSVTVVYSSAMGNGSAARFGNVGMNIYPNPFSVNGTLEMVNSGDAANAIVEIFNLKGEKVMDVYQGEIAAEGSLRLDIDGSALSEGVYVCRVICGEEVINQRLVIKK